MTEPKPLTASGVYQAEAEAQRKLDDYLGILAPWRDEPARTCELFDAGTCPFCDHYEECAARDLELPTDAPKRSKRHVPGE